MTRATRLLVLAALLSAPAALATGPGPVPGFNAAATPLVKVNATTVGIRASSSSQSGYMSAVQASDLVYALANLGGGGGGTGATVSSSITGAQSQCATFYPIDNTPPLVSEGCQIATVNVTPLSLGERIVVQGHAIVGNSGASHNACWLTQDADPAHATTSQFMSASDVGDVDMTVIWVTSAATTSARSYSIYCASDSANSRILYINAAYTGNAEFGGTYSSGVWVTEYAGASPVSGGLTGIPFSATSTTFTATPTVGMCSQSTSAATATGALVTDGCTLDGTSSLGVGYFNYACRVTATNVVQIERCCINAALGCASPSGEPTTFTGFTIRR